MLPNRYGSDYILLLMLVFFMLSKWSLGHSSPSPPLLPCLSSHSLQVSVESVKPSQSNASRYLSRGEGRNGLCYSQLKQFLSGILSAGRNPFTVSGWPLT